MFTPNTKLHELSEKELLNYFNRLFDTLTMNHGSYNVFDNYLDCCINGFSYDYSQEIMDYIRKKYCQEERYMFGEMLNIWILCLHKNVTDDNSYHDFLGSFYEQKAMTKQNGFAQYFTPDPICKFMVDILAVDEGARYVAEPACGSGRFNLAMHARNHKLLHHANDLDMTCAKMTAVNFAVHGIKGIVTCDDALLPGRSFKGAFVTNWRSPAQIDYVDDVNMAYSFINGNFVSQKQPFKVDFKKLEAANLPAEKVDNPKSISELGKQLSIF